MPMQLTIFGDWEEVGEPKTGAAARPEPEPGSRGQAPADPRQLEIFAGPHTHQRAMADALEALDAPKLRDTFRAVRRIYPTWLPAEAWPLWADGIEWLVGPERAPLPPAVRADRALALLDDGVARERFPDLGEDLLAVVRVSAAARACEALLSSAGPQATLADGRAAGLLPLLAGGPEKALGPLQAAVAAGLADGGTQAALADALWRMGRRREALVACRDALLIDPSSLEEIQDPSLLALLDEIEELDLPGEPRAWIPALADLRGLVSLPDLESEVDPCRAPAARFTSLLARYRRQRREGAAATVLVEAKRALLQIAPALKEWIRRL
jgi:hypothetical protein